MLLPEATTDAEAAYPEQCYKKTKKSQILR